MKTIDTNQPLDLDLAPAKLTFAVIAKALGARLLVLYRVFRNRREVMRLEDFTEAQLADIGLTRDDVRTSLEARWFEDPSAHLVTSARRRRGRTLRLL